MQLKELKLGKQQQRKSLGGDDAIDHEEEDIELEDVFNEEDEMEGAGLSGLSGLSQREEQGTGVSQHAGPEAVLQSRKTEDQRKGHAFEKVCQNLTYARVMQCFHVATGLLMS
jgi:hypothetical protein